MRYLVTLHTQDLGFSPPYTPDDVDGDSWEVFRVQLTDIPSPYGVDQKTLIVIWISR